MSASRFVWVNKTPNSRSLSNSYADTDERYQLNSHVQDQRKPFKSSCGGGALLSSEPASQSIARWIRYVHTQERLQHLSVTAKQWNKRKEIERPPSRQFLAFQTSGHLVRQIPCRPGSIDPFQSLAVNVSPEAWTVIDTYREVCAGCPLAWDLPPYGNTPDNDGMLTSFASNRLRYYSLVTLTASALRLLGVATVRPQLTPIFFQKALQEINKHIIMDIDDDELLTGIARIFMAAVLEADDFAARAHLKAAVILVRQRGGIDKVEPGVRKCLTYGDLHLAVETLSPTVFPLASDPGEWPGDEITPDASLERLTTKLLAESRTSILTRMYHILENIVSCIIMLASAIKQSPPSESKLMWIATRCATTLARLLACRYQSGTGPSDPCVFQGMKATFVLWIQLLLLVMNELMVPVSVRNNIVTVNHAMSKPMTDFPAEVSSGLQKWNARVQLARAQALPEAKDSFLALVAIVESMEVSLPVRLGPCMQRLLSLRLQRRAPVG